MLDKNFTHLILIAFITSNIAFAQDDSIIVSADRIKSFLDKSPSDIKVFEKSEIEKSSNITELFASESDLQISQSGPAGGNTSLFLRGTDSSQTLVIVDGITMNDPSNPNRQFDLGRLSLNNIERIEILKGSQGLLYGSNAIGGVILITTNKAEKKASGSALVDYGTFDTFNSAINVQKKINKSGLSLGIDHLTTRGFSAANINNNLQADDDGEKRTTISTGLTQELSKDDELVFNYHYVNDEVDLDKGGGPKNDDPNDSQFTEQQFMKAGYNHTWATAETQFQFTKTLHHRSLNVKADNTNPAASSTTTNGTIKAVGINHTQFTTDFLTQNFNFDYQHEEDQLKNFNDNLSFFLYNRVDYGPAVFNFGARLDSNKYFGQHVTYKAAVMHNFSKFNLKMSYSTGLRAPSLNQLYDPTYGNKNLRAEESQTAEIGFDIPVSELAKYLGTVFYTDLQNRLSYDPNTFINQNRGTARILGFENNFNINIGKGFAAALSATWLSARDLTANQKLARRPELNSKLILNYKNEKNSASIAGDFTGKRQDVENNGNIVSLPSFIVFNLNYAYEFNQSFSTYMKIKNILNKDYEEVFGYGTGGRAYTIGLKYVF